MNMKTCSNCGNLKQLSEFYSAPRCSLGVSPHCISCTKTRASLWNKKNKAKRKKIAHKNYENHKQEKFEYTYKWKEQNSEAVKVYSKKARLKHRYLIDMEDYNILFELQGGCCAICGIHQSKLKRALAVDHDHVTNHIRGLLCGNCNTGLGLFKDSVPNLNKAIKYLEAR